MRHFAGEVTYAVNRFLEKNRDQFPNQLQNMMEYSQVSLLKLIFGNFGTNDTIMAKRKGQNGKGKSKSKGNGKKTICGKFKIQLRRLSSTLQSTYPHYIRCIKPNNCRLRPIDGIVAFDAQKTFSQLLYSGVIEVCRIKKQGFPYRMKINQFYEKCNRDGICRLLSVEGDVLSKSKYPTSNILSLSIIHS